MSIESELRSALAAAKAKLEEQDAYIQDIQEASTSIGICLERIGDKALVSVGGSIVFMKTNRRVNPKVGEILLVANTMHGFVMTDIVKTDILGTRLATFVRHEGSLYGIVSINGEERKVICPQKLIEKGSQVAIDDSGMCILRNLGHEKKTVTAEVTNVHWDDIGGLEEAKLALREMIEWPRTFAGLYKQYGKRSTKGVLLYGPPGCGKTLLAKATASSINNGGMFLYVKGPELLSMWVGEGERMVRDLFARARENKNATLFIDEADALLGKRGGNRSVATDSMVPAFLAEMDGLDKDGPVVLLATNRPDSLDDAVVREGRIDRKVYVNRPTEEDALDIFAMYLVRTKVQKTVSELISRGMDLIFSHPVVLFHCIHEDNKQTAITLKDVVSGSMIETIVDQARAKAIIEDIAAKRSTAGGVSVEHISKAVSDIVQAHKNMNNQDVFSTHEERHGKITSIVPAA